MPLHPMLGKWVSITFSVAKMEMGKETLVLARTCFPGIYARAWLEGRLTLEQMESFRQETDEGSHRILILV